MGSSTGEGGSNSEGSLCKTTTDDGGASLAPRLCTCITNLNSSAETPPTPAPTADTETVREGGGGEGFEPAVRMINVGESVMPLLPDAAANVTLNNCGTADADGRGRSRTANADAAPHLTRSALSPLIST